jgi:hypothetical protein
MTTPSAKRLVTVTAVAALLAGCSGTSQSTLSPSQSIPQSSHSSNLAGRSAPSPVSRPGSLVVHAATGKSWIKPDGTKSKALLYVSNVGTATVGIYRYTSGNNTKLVGTLTGFATPYAPCSDTSGNVYIPDYSNSDIVEYAYGATKPTQTIQDPDGFPTNCSVDPKTGNLAVANFGAGNFGVYNGNTGTPTTYTVSNLTNPEFVGFDNNSDLYINGFGNSTDWQLAVLPNGTTTPEAMTVSGASTYFAGGVQWGGTYLLVGDQGSYDVTTSFIDQISVSGTTGTIVNQISLAGTSDAISIPKRGAVPLATAAGGDYATSTGYSWGFPSGAQQSTFSGLSEPFGATFAQKR